jgi:hypothetical protein
VGQIFGSRSAPSFYCLLTDVPQSLAATLPIATMDYLNLLVTQCALHISTTSPSVEVPPDSHHPPLTPNELASPHHKSFVDDTGVAAYVENMLQTLNNIVSFLLSGFLAHKARTVKAIASRTASGSWPSSTKLFYSWSFSFAPTR